MAREGQLLRQSGIWDIHAILEKHSQNISIIKFGIVFWPRCLTKNKSLRRCSSWGEKTVWGLDTFSDAEFANWAWNRSNRGILLYSEKFLIWSSSDGNSPGMLCLEPELLTYLLLWYLSLFQQTRVWTFCCTFPAFSLVIPVCPFSCTCLFMIYSFCDTNISKVSFYFNSLRSARIEAKQVICMHSPIFLDPFGLKLFPLAMEISFSKGPV